MVGKFDVGCIVRECMADPASSRLRTDAGNQQKGWNSFWCARRTLQGGGVRGVGACEIVWGQRGTFRQALCGLPPRQQVVWATRMKNEEKNRLPRRLRLLQ
jgi:hypothetical protein